MKPLASCLFAFALLCAAAGRSTSADEPKKDEAVPCKVDQLSKEWNLKVKGVTLKEAPDPKNPGKLFVITLEFTKDATDVKAIRTAFQALGILPNPKDNATRVLCYFFDEDSVALVKGNVYTTEGEITGKMGDAFRVSFRCQPFQLEKVKRIELRPSETDK